MNWTSNNNSPVCMDNSSENVWIDWGASQRDLYVLDMNGELVLHQNITSGLPDNLETMVIDLLDQAGTEICSLNDVYVSEAHTSGNPVNYIEIYNYGEEDCSLEGFKLDDNQEMDDLTFGGVVIPAGGYWLGYEDEDSSFSSELSNDGDEVWLSDPLGNTKMVSLSASVELEDTQLSQSFSINGDGCYTIPTPGENNADCITLGIDTQNSLPKNISLLNNFPNPFNPTTYIPIKVKNSENISLKIYDMSGRLVKNIFSGSIDSGKHTFHWSGRGTNGKQVGSGVYLYVVKSESVILSKKVVFTK